VIEAAHVDIGLLWQVPLMGLLARVLKSVGARGVRSTLGAGAPISVSV
jgi:hypothetical protein